MSPEDFEQLLDKAAVKLNDDLRASTNYHKPDDFEQRVFDVLREVASEAGAIDIKPTFHPHAFPDIRANGYGVEVKTTIKDSWLTVGNSVFEGMRDPSVKKIYVMFGKMGGAVAVRWGRYEELITHVRISHAPRFVIEMDRDSPLFKQPSMGVDYEQFCQLPPGEKMSHIRDYSRHRLKPGEQLWWLEDETSPGMGLEVTLYMKLPAAKKIELRAEGAILFPQICGGSRVKNKYNQVSFFFLKYHNVFCPQARDLYSAGSVAGKERGGNYLLRALTNIEDAMREAAQRLDGALFEEYWGQSVEPQDRLRQWLRRADEYAKKNWTPSDHLFLPEQGKAKP